jgi:poly-gamma-glutamate synthesis protein (capsule biosynthesis protein)
VQHFKRPLSLIFILALAAIVSFFVGKEALAQKAPEKKAFKFDPKRPPEAELKTSIQDGFTLAAVGDCIIARPLSQVRDPRFTALIQILRDADAAVGNCETSFIDIRQFKGSPQAETGSWYLIAPVDVAKDLKLMGFDLMSRANNHVMDWGLEGMRETSYWLDQAGIVHAGCGENRALARAPRYFESDKGRIGLVSMGATFTTLSQSMPPLGQAPGRPGMNAIKTKRTTIVPPEVMKALVHLRDSMRSARKAAGGEIEQESPPQESQSAGKLPETLTLLGQHFKLGDRFAYTYEMDPIDFNENLKNVRQGKQFSDFLLAAIHNHESGVGPDEPGDFHIKLAHAVIDAGADAFIGSGEHRLRPIEIYKGRPIFYSLCDFFWDDKQEPFAADYYEQYREDLKAAFGDPDKATDADLAIVLNSLDWGSPTEDNLAFQSVIALNKYEGGQVREIRLYPVDLGYGLKFTESGIPRVPAPEMAQRILKRLQKMSEPYGTKIDIEENIGIIRVPKVEAKSE